MAMTGRIAKTTIIISRKRAVTFLIIQRRSPYSQGINYKYTSYSFYFHEKA